MGQIASNTLKSVKMSHFRHQKVFLKFSEGWGVSFARSTLKWWVELLMPFQLEAPEYFCSQKDEKSF